jgi:hypothetical protein
MSQAASAGHGLASGMASVHVSAPSRLVDGGSAPRRWLQSVLVVDRACRRRAWVLNVAGADVLCRKHRIARATGPERGSGSARSAQAPESRTDHGPWGSKSCRGAVSASAGGHGWGLFITFHCPLSWRVCRHVGASTPVDRDPCGNDARPDRRRGSESDLDALERILLRAS